MGRIESEIEKKSGHSVGCKPAATFAVITKTFGDTGTTFGFEPDSGSQIEQGPGGVAPVRFCERDSPVHASAIVS
jgi:hypothetical protein